MTCNFSGCYPGVFSCTLFSSSSEDLQVVKVFFMVCEVKLLLSYVVSLRVIVISVHVLIAEDAVFVGNLYSVAFLETLLILAKT